MDSIVSRSVVEIAACIARGELSCEDVAHQFLARIAEREPDVHAWAFLDPEAVLAQARYLDQTPRIGPLHGVPIGIKDIIDTADMPTQMGSPIYANHRPAVDAACVARLRAAGALILGKTVTAEFAGSFPGPTANPLDLGRTPGGSSSGSAAAVADGMVPVALGTQTGGSVHRPASYCGVIGFKPTRAYINRAGIKFAAESLDVIGIIAHDLGDVEAVFATLSNTAAGPLQPRAPKRAGLCRTPMWNRAQPETRAAVERAAERIAQAGIPVDEVELGAPFDELSSVREIVNNVQRAHGMAHEWREHPEAISDTLAKAIRAGLATPASKLAWALQTIEACRTAIAPVLAEHELLIAPCVDGEAPLGLGHTGEYPFQSFWTMLDTPSVSLPAHRGPNGMPVSVQLVGPAYADRELLDVARWAADVLPSIHLTRSS